MDFVSIVRINLGDVFISAINVFKRVYCTCYQMLSSSMVLLFLVKHPIKLEKLDLSIFGN